MSQETASYDCSADCLHIDIGCVIFIQCKELSERVKSQLVGLVPGRYLIISSPESLITMSFCIKEVIVRYMYRGEVLGFKSSIIGQIDRPFRLTFLSYPSSVERLNLRKAHRIACNLPAEINLKEKKIAGIIVDLSVGGCRMIAKLEDPTQGTLVLVGVELGLTFTVPGISTELTFKAVIRNTLLSMDKAELGLQFQDTDIDKKQVLEEYVQRVSRFS